MFVLKNLGIKTFGKAFVEQKVKPDCSKDVIGQYSRAGYVLTAKHVCKNIYLLKSSQDYLLLHVTDNESLDAEGLIVENTDAALEILWNKKLVDIFDGGKVGEMQIHLPAFRDSSGKIIYLVDKSQADNFYINDFQNIKGNYDN